MFLPSTITLAPGDSGEFVAELQRRLGSLHLYPSEAISGVYDGMTTNSVSSFQQQQGLRSDGIAGPETLRRLNGVISGTYNETLEKQQATTDPLAVERMAQVHLTGQDEAFSFTQPIAEAMPALYEQRPAESAAKMQMSEQPAMQMQQAATMPMQPAIVEMMQPPPMQPLLATQALSDIVQHAPPTTGMTEKTVAPISAETPLQPRPVALDQASYTSPENPWMAKPQAPASPPVAEVKPEIPVQAAAYAATSASAPAPALAEPVKIPAIKPAAQDIAPEMKAPPAPQPAMQQAPIMTSEALAPAKPQAAQATEALPEKPAQAPTLRERISGLVQRIAEYMEAKLPPSVLNEVQQIGASMHARGIKEIPLPAGDNALPSPSVTPVRGAAAAPERAG